MGNSEKEQQSTRFEWLVHRIYGLPTAEIGDWGARREFQEQRDHCKTQEPSEGKGQRSEWRHVTEEGDLGGRVRSLALTTDGKKLYAGTASGGVWCSERTEKGWGTWYALENDLHFAVGAIALDPLDQGILYVGTGEPYVRILYRGVGVLRLEEGNEEPCEIGPSCLNYVAQILIHVYASKPKHSVRKVLYCAGDGGLFSTEDGGSSWKKEFCGNVTSIAIDSCERLLIGVYGEGIFYRDKSQKGWLKLSIPCNPQYRALVRSKVEETKEYYYVRLDHDLYVSSDRGQHWSKPEQVSLQGVDLDWASHIWVHPIEQRKLLVGGVKLKWGLAPLNSALPGAIPSLRELDVRGLSEKERQTFVDHHDAVSSIGGEIFAACDGGVYRKKSEGSSWVYMSGLDASQFYDLAVSPHDSTILGGGTQDLGTWIRTANREWVRILPFDGGHLVFDPHDSSIVWAQTQMNRIYRLKIPENAASFSIRRIIREWYESGLENDKAPFIGILVADPKLPNVIYTGRQHVFRLKWETDGENLWIPISPEFEGMVSALAKDLKGNIFSGTSNGELWWMSGEASHANKGNWEELADTSSVRGTLPRRYINRILITPKQQCEIFVCFGGKGKGAGSPEDLKPKEVPGQVFHGVRTQGFKGSEWIFRDCSGVGETALPNAAAHGLAIHREFLFIATDFGVFQATVGEWVWQRLPGLPLVPCFDICISPSNDSKSGHLLRVATHGRGIFEREI